MYSIFQSFCCCNGEDSDDQGPLIDDVDDGHFEAATTCDSTSNFWANDAERHMTSHSTPKYPNNSRQGNDEDELLNQILEATQQNIIDVANMDGTTAPYKEDLSKAQRYGDAIRQHDLRVRRHALHVAPVDGIVIDFCLLFDVGPRVIEVLQRPEKVFTAHSDLRDFAGNMSAAMVNGIQIQHKYDILIHMNFSDE